MILTLPVVIAAVTLLPLALRLIQSLTSPLRKVPGPSITNLTSLVLRWKEFKGCRTTYIHELHRRYGPVVRIAPDEVSFTSWVALKEIYCSGGSGYDKSEFYDLFQIFGQKPMFAILNKTEHAKRKRLLADRYANSNIIKGASLSGIQERASRFIQRCASTAGGVSDIYMPLHAYACDCITHHLFHPYDTDCLRKNEDEEMMHQITADDSAQNRLISRHAPILHLLFSKILSLIVKPRETPLMDRYVLETSGLTGFADFALMSRLEAKTDDDLDSIVRAAECYDHIAAGIDTTGDGLCFLMWELSRPRSLRFQRRLTEELLENPDAPADQLPLLDAVICEGLRCYPPIPMSLPRLVPPGGRSIDGFWLPENTTVSCQPWSVQRTNSDVFPDPEVFNPDRWLQVEGDAERKRLLFAFSNGGRGCIGKHLALAEMRTLLRSVYTKFSTTLDGSMTDDMMEFSEQLISARPLGQKCLLEFSPLKE